MEASPLLRHDVSDHLEILQCRIRAEVEPTLTHARYVYSYRVKRKSMAAEEWRDIYAYPDTDFVMEFAGKGDTEGKARAHGLQYSVGPLSPEDENACLVISFDGQMKASEIVAFTYACRTRIEQVSNLSWFGGRGCVWYWNAHEYPCKDWQLELILPRGLYLDGIDPEPVVSEDGWARFGRSNLAPAEFASGLVTFEKRVLGLPVRYARWADRIVAFAVGVMTSLLAAIIYHHFLGG